VAKFCASGGCALAWDHDGQPTAQAKALIELFKQASIKGLRPDNYNAPRWDARLAALAPSNPHRPGTIWSCSIWRLPFARCVTSEGAASTDMPQKPNAMQFRF
jgi:hypothetical protein